MECLDTLPDLPAIEGPLFVFAHIVSPHWPYVFDHDGGFVADAPNDSKPAYIEQVRYLNDRLLRILPEIIAGSRPHPSSSSRGIMARPGPSGIRTA
jgi:hypothetical protein